MTLKLVSDNPAPRRAPRAPATLGKIGQQEWRRVIAMLSENERVADHKLALIQSYCEAIEGERECAAILKKQGRVVKVKDGPPKAHPAVRQHLQYSQQALRLAEKLGIVAGADSKQRKVNDVTPNVFD